MYVKLIQSAVIFCHLVCWKCEKINALLIICTTIFGWEKKSDFWALPAEVYNSGIIIYNDTNQKASNTSLYVLNKLNDMLFICQN